MPIPRNSIGNPIQIHSKFIRFPVQILSTSYVDPIQILCTFFANAVGIYQKSDAKIRGRCTLRWVLHWVPRNLRAPCTLPPVDVHWHRSTISIFPMTAKTLIEHHLPRGVHSWGWCTLVGLVYTGASRCTLPPG